MNYLAQKRFTIVDSSAIAATAIYLSNGALVMALIAAAVGMLASLSVDAWSKGKQRR